MNGWSKGLRRFVLRGWAWILLVPALAAGLTRSDVTYHMEAMTLAPSQETWQRQRGGESDAWLLPSLYDRPRVNKPPLTVWANMLAWTGLDQAAPTDVLVARARILAVALSILAVLATGWAGLSLGNRRLAVAAMLVMASMLLFLRQGRLASYDTYLLAWCTLSVAAGWHAVLRARSSAGRWASWLVAGVAMGLAVLSKGPVAYLFTIAPVAGAMIVRNKSGGQPWIGLALAAVISAGLAVPWYLHASGEVAGTMDRLLHEYRADRTKSQPPWYYLGLVGLVFPWSIALVGAAIGAVRDTRVRTGRAWMLPALAWFVWVFVALSVPEAKQQRYIVPVLPAAALLIAWWFLYGVRRTAGRAVWIRMHQVLLVAATAGYAVFLLGQDAMVRAGWLRAPEVVGLSAFVVVGVVAVLSVLALLGWRCARGDRRIELVAVTALWMAAAAAPAFHGYALSPRKQFAARAHAERVDAVAGSYEVFYFREPGRPWWEVEPDAKFLLYSRRAIAACDPQLLYDGDAAPEFVLAEDRPEAARALASAGYQHQFTFAEKRSSRVLWRRFEVVRDAR